jgi:hypothetical protein
MSTIGNTAPTLLDVASQFNGNSIVPMIDVIAQENAILADIPFVEGNAIFGHRFTQTATRPTGTYRRLNKGVEITKGTTMPVIKPCAMLESFSQIDTAEVDHMPNPAEVRRRVDIHHAAGMGETFASTLFYGNTITAPEKFDGLARLIPTLSSVDARGVPNVIGASGTGDDVTSIYIVQWGPGRVEMFYPMGSTAGMSMEDLGRQKVLDSSGNPYMAYETHFKWFAGLAVYNDRCIQRIANIESAGSSNIFNDDHLLTALNRLPGEGRGAVIYCNNTVKTQMDILAKAKSNVAYTSAEVFGRPTTLFRGVPVRVCDAILNTESAISA